MTPEGIVLQAVVILRLCRAFSSCNIYIYIYLLYALRFNWEKNVHQLCGRKFVLIFYGIVATLKRQVFIYIHGDA